MKFGWVYETICILILYFSVKDKFPKSRTAKTGKVPIAPIKTNEACFKCGERFTQSELRHKLTGNCFNCISKDEDLLVEALDLENIYKNMIVIDRRLYDLYLVSDKWKTIRKKAIESSNSKCINCGSKNNLQVHHNTYDRLGNEDLTDLAVLCKECHVLAHTRGAKVKLSDFDADEYLNSISIETQESAELKGIDQKNIKNISV